MKYYLIHNLDKDRKKRMLDSFIKANINNDDVIWMRYPNKEHITEEIIKNCVAEGLTYSNGTVIYAQQQMTKGLISCTLKHYLALKDIVKNNYEYAVIMEDNMILGEDVCS